VAAAASSASAGGSIQLYSAKATFACLKKRPEYRSFPALFAEGRHKKWPVLLVDSPTRIPAMSGVPGVDLPLPVTLMTVLYLRPSGESSHLTFFDTARAAQAGYRSGLRKGAIPHGTRLDRNILISWVAASAHLRSIVLGCLRTA
jgi:hypothetical protein